MLIIIGLIVGGVLGGQSLIKSAELQRVVNEFRQYETAFNAFRLEYSAIPGDMDNAQDYWSTCTDDGVNLCKGNGDGIIDQGSPREDLRGWQHLSLAGIVPGNYTGVEEVVDSKKRLIGGVNVPKLAGSDGNIIWYQREAGDGQGIYDTANWLVNFQLGASNPALSIRPHSGFTPKEAKAIDVKADDGLPAIGNLQSSDGGEAFEFGDLAEDNCVTYEDVTGGSLAKVKDGTGNEADVKYRLSQQGVVCRIGYGVI